MTTMAFSSFPILALIRHGAYHQRKNTPSALQPFQLSEAGKQEIVLEAKKFASFIKENNWALHPVVHSSNQLRAWQTAEIYQRELADIFSEAPTHITHNDLSERSVGSLANLTIKEIEDVLKSDPRFEVPPENWKSDSHYCLPLQGAESLMMAGKRVSNYLVNQSIKKHLVTEPTETDKEVRLFFGHGASFRHAAFHLNVINMCDIKQFSMHHGRAVMIQQQIDGQWQHIAGEWKIRQQLNSFND
ncbi:histidine phosphatase family protein [Marinomonas algicola]|uniref:histidine phosphatase family protein n=1 Tax=Marinomonas algicola TaxID=2773454 RepID=UPI001EFEF61D|nr:histidine phosphatase family protein [Marinomonas algicola]